ncbi:MAG: L7Ae/L30e/S12e/Gadd45 family ribosomal protein [Bacilli bacterium]
MNSADVLNAIGLCKRANRIVSGESMVIDSIKHNVANLVLISADCEKNTYNKIINKCKFYNVEFVQLAVDKYDLGNSIGKDIRVCVAIEDKGFKEMILKKIRSD